MNKLELIQSLPERLRGHSIVGPFDNLDEANRQAAFYSAAFGEAIATNEKYAVNKRQFLTETEIVLSLTRLFREEFGNRSFEFVGQDTEGLRQVSEWLDFDEIDLTKPLLDFGEQHLLEPVKKFIEKIGSATKFSKLRAVHGVDMKGFAEDWVKCFSVRMVRAYDISLNARRTRMDALVK